MTTQQTSTLAGPALDWAVAKCEEYFVRAARDSCGRNTIRAQATGTEFPFQPSSDWSQGGPIIERERITLDAVPDNGWRAYIRNPEVIIDTWKAGPLVVAMRCYVASKMGDTVNIPEELC